MFELCSFTFVGISLSQTFSKSEVTSHLTPPDPQFLSQYLYHCWQRLRNEILSPSNYIFFLCILDYFLCNGCSLCCSHLIPFQSVLPPPHIIYSSSATGHRHTWIWRCWLNWLQDKLQPSTAPVSMKIFVLILIKCGGFHKGQILYRWIDR